MDEPTNNLDIESIDALADALSVYEGGVVLVSHGARLIRSANCLLWVCDKQNVLPFPGEFDDYKATLMESIQDEERDLEEQLERRRREEEEARLAATRKRAQQIRELRLRREADGGAPGAPPA